MSQFEQGPQGPQGVPGPMGALVSRELYEKIMADVEGQRPPPVKYPWWLRWMKRK